MKKEEIRFLADILEKSHWLFYGDLDEYFDDFVKKVFSRELSEWGFSNHKEVTPDFMTAYCLLLSEFDVLGLIEYGTSPRGAWLTEKGERFKKIILENKKAIEEANEFIYNKYV